jgi:hypothetical protein
MPSRSLQQWEGQRAADLDEIQDAHAAVGGTGRGRRYATQQINHAYVMLLSSQFQAFCRDLHSEAVDHLVNAVQPASLRIILRARLTEGRQLDKGNPNPGNIGSDYGRFGLDLWPEVRHRDARSAQRKTNLEALNAWRNAIAHQDFDPAKLGGATTIGLADVRRCRSSCTGLARSFDRVLAAHLATLVGGAPPW